MIKKRWMLLSAVLVGACQTPGILEPPTGPGTDYPCGVNGVVCLDMAGKPNGGCCSEGETCGGGKWSVGCPADMCCNIREPPVLQLRIDAGKDGSP